MDFEKEYCANEQHDQLSAFINNLYALYGFLIVSVVLIKLAEKNCQIKYDSFIARVVFGSIKFSVHLFHAQNSPLALPTDKGCIVVAGPHQTGFKDAATTVSEMPAGMSPPRVAATDSFNVLPGFESFMQIFHVIPVVSGSPTFSSMMLNMALFIDIYGSDKYKALPSVANFLKHWGYAIKEVKKENGKTANQQVLEEARETLKQGGCYLSFIQGNLVDNRKLPFPVYGGAAELAIEENMPIYLIRKDGYWCVNSSYLPSAVTNWMWYRAIFSMLHPSNIRNTLIVLDYHLKDEAKDLSYKEKFDELCAQQYAYYRHSRDLSPKDIGEIANEIERGEHRPIWQARRAVESLSKEIKAKEKNLDELRKACLEGEKRLFNPKESKHQHAVVIDQKAIPVEQTITFFKSANEALVKPNVDMLHQSTSTSNLILHSDVGIETDPNMATQEDQRSASSLKSVV